MRHLRNFLEFRCLRGLFVIIYTQVSKTKCRKQPEGRDSKFKILLKCCKPESEKRAVVVSKHGDYDVSGEHGDGGLLSRHHALGEVSAGAPVEAPSGVVRHLNSQLRPNNLSDSPHLAALNDLVVINIDLLLRGLPLPELPLAARLLPDGLGRVDTFESAEN